MRRRFFYFLIFVSFFFFIKPVYARSVSLTTDLLTFISDSPQVLTSTYSGFTTGESIYVKGAFFKEGSSNYFGYTKFNTNWIKNSETTVNQKEIIIDSWDGSIEVKPDYLDSGFLGDGQYSLKLGYYYKKDNGSISEVTWSTNSIPVTITAPTPTPTNTPVPITPTHTPQPSNTPVPPSATPNPTVVPSNTTKPSLQPTNTVKIVKIPTLEPTQTADITQEQTQEPIDTPLIPSPVRSDKTEQVDQINNASSNKYAPYIIALSFIGLGTGLLCILLLLLKFREAELHKKMIEKKKASTDQ